MNILNLNKQQNFKHDISKLKLYSIIYLKVLIVEEQQI